MVEPSDERAGQLDVDRAIDLDDHDRTCDARLPESPFRFHWCADCLRFVDTFGGNVADDNDRTCAGCGQPRPCAHHEPHHGTRARYRKGCHDECCRSAEREYRRRYRTRKAKANG